VRRQRDDCFARPTVAVAHDRVGDDAMVSAALPPASAAARKETRVGGHVLLLYAWRSSVPSTRDVAAPSQMEQSVDMCGGLSQLVHVGIAVLVGERFWMGEAKQQRWRSLLSPSWRRDHGRRDRQ
jgi:hypothetical protein